MAHFARILEPVTGSAGPTDLQHVGEAIVVKIVGAHNERVGVTARIVGVGRGDSALLFELGGAIPEWAGNDVGFAVVVDVGDSHAFGKEHVGELLFGKADGLRVGGDCREGDGEQEVEENAWWRGGAKGWGRHGHRECRVGLTFSMIVYPNPLR